MDIYILLILEYQGLEGLIIHRIHQAHLVIWLLKLYAIHSIHLVLIFLLLELLFMKLFFATDLEWDEIVKKLEKLFVKNK